MNANELADYLQNQAEIELRPRLQEAAIMLRQQQAEIEAAEQKVLNAFERGKMFGYAQGLRKAQEKCNGFCGEYECKENQSNCKRKAQEK